MSMITKIGKPSAFRTVVFSAFLAFAPTISCAQERPQKKTTSAKCTVHGMSRDSVIRAFENAKQTGNHSDNLYEARNALKGKFKLNVRGKKIEIYNKEDKKIGEFNVTQGFYLSVFSLGDLLAIADRHTVALYNGAQYLTFDCSDKPFEYKPRIGIKEQAGTVTVVFASSSMGGQIANVVTLPTKLSAEGLSLLPNPPPIKIDPNDPSANP